MDFELRYPDVAALLRSVGSELDADLDAEAGVEDAGCRAMLGEGHPDLVLTR